ncbi:uncharacterized protein LOC120103686 isoform X1 [Phoenix dactylifera]|uniref:Uncharacterized protein LOC120103686 isoform X1 n=2 Tax=Phoenix dactylifera TaxID=42345 RepID=A0A8B8ZS85_PHODC|nr:uncharacterized protein LOC120103686 isoform X1 [Phoenix dactylifera]
MSSPNLRDLLTAFSPSSDFFATTSGDGRIKIWDTVKGQLQTEFVDIASSDTSNMLSEPKSGHLSLDYTCMKWVQLGSKKRKKPGSSLLVLGTGSGDVLALDVSAGQLRWKVSDCHPGGVSAVSFSKYHHCVYTAGVDGMVCQIDTKTGSIICKFRSSSKAISSLSISADGRIMATAAAQLKVFNCSDNKKIQKLSGHPVAVRCMIFSEDGKYILSSGVGERYVAIWKVGGGKKQSASCVLSMEHPAIFLDSKSSDAEGTDDEGLYVLAISETGLCYFWYGSSIDNLRNRKPTKISLSIDPSLAKNNTGMAVYAAKFQSIIKPASGQVFIAHGSLIKPTFEKVMVQYGTDVNLGTYQSGVLLPMDKSSIVRKAQATQTKGTITALDRANAEDAVLPLPKLYGQDKKRKHAATHVIADMKIAMVDSLSNKNKVLPVDTRVSLQQMKEDDVICLEDRLRAAGILGSKADLSTGSYPSSPIKTATDIFGGSHLSVDANVSAKKIRAHILSMSSSDAYKFLEILVSALKTRSASTNHAIPWIYCILVNHGHFIISQESSAQLLNCLQKMTGLKCAAIEPLLKLSGRFRLIMTQIDMAGKCTVQPQLAEHHSDDGEEEDIDELIYGEEDESQSGSDDDNSR